MNIYQRGRWNSYCQLDFFNSFLFDVEQTGTFVGIITISTCCLINIIVSSSNSRETSRWIMNA